MDTEGQFTLGYRSRSVKLIIHLQQLFKSRMRGALCPNLLYDFEAWCVVKQRLGE